MRTPITNGGINPRIIMQLIDTNTHAGDKARCSNLICSGIRCSDCPISKQHHKGLTIGDVRKMDPRAPARKLETYRGDIPKAAGCKRNVTLELIKEAAGIVEERGSDNGYDAGKERSAAQVATIFNSLTGHNLTERDAWLFMICLKLVRNQSKQRRDNILDLIGYAALMGECQEG